MTLNVRLYHQQQAKFVLFIQSGRRGTNALNRTVLPKCPELLVAACGLKVRDTQSSYSNQTSISWIQWLGKRRKRGELRALGGLQCHGDMHKLGHWEKEHGYGNPAVSMATAVLTQLLPPHLGKYAAIRKRHVLLYAGCIIKYSQSMTNSLLLPLCSGAFHLFPSDFGKEMWISSPCSISFY